MKAFLLAVVALVVISVAANQFLIRAGFSAADQTTSSDNVRLDD